MFADTKKRDRSFEHCRRWLLGVGVVALAVTLSAAAPATAAAAPGGATVFVQSAKSGKLGGGRLLLAGVSGRISWATNSGRAGEISLHRLHRRLIPPGKPATGTLHIAGQRGGQEQAFRLSRPRYNPARHTVAYRATPLAKRRAARAAGFRRPRRFGAASLSIIPHPALMGTSPQGGPTCSVTMNNQSDRDLTATNSDFQLIGTWRPVSPLRTAPPLLIKEGGQATWEAVGTVGGRCLNAGTYTMSESQFKVTFSIDSADPFRASCDAPEYYVCLQMSQSGNDVVWQLVGPR